MIKKTAKLIKKQVVSVTGDESWFESESTIAEKLVNFRFLYRLITIDKKYY